MAMGTLSVQPPSGASRNLTEVFILLRNNAQQNKFMYANTNPTSDEKMSLVALDEELGMASAGTSTRIPPEWVNYFDETQYEFTRIRSRMKQIRETQQNNIAKPNFAEDTVEQDKIDANTEEITHMLTHCQRLIGFIEKADVKSGTQQSLLRDNVAATLRMILTNMAGEFRSSQASYLKQIETRKETVDSFLFATSNDWVNTEILDDAPVDSTGEGLTMEQIQILLQNADMVKERERDVICVSKSIVELNTLFKDLASLIIDQGTILDRIDYNVEQSTMRVKSALKSVQKAEQYQKGDKKMHCIVCLSVSIVVLLILLIIVKT